MPRTISLANFALPAGTFLKKPVGTPAMTREQQNITALALCAFLGVNCYQAARDGDNQLENVNYVDCTTFRSSNELPEHLVEAAPNYVEELAALDLNLLPEEIDISSLSALRRALIAYMLELPLEDLGDTLAPAQLDTSEPLIKAALGAFAKAALNEEDGYDFYFLRRGLHHYYTCSRQFPATLDDFYRHYGSFTDASSNTVDSKPKAGPRRLAHLAHKGIYRAESFIGTAVKETEFLIKNARGDGALDFVAYDQNGDLVTQSEFAASTGQLNLAATPYACMTCHRDSVSSKFEVINPDKVD